MLKLKLQYFGHLMRRVDSLEKTLMLGGIGGRRKRGIYIIMKISGQRNKAEPFYPGTKRVMLLIEAYERPDNK